MSSDAESGGHRSFSLVLGVLAVWTAITVFGARLIYSGDISLEEVVKNGIAWQLVAAVVFLFAVILRRQWVDLGLRGPLPGTLQLLWFPVLILFLLGAGALALGPPPALIMLMVLINTALVGFSEEVMFHGVFYSARVDRRRWPKSLASAPSVRWIWFEFPRIASTSTAATGHRRRRRSTSCRTGTGRTGRERTCPSMSTRTAMRPKSSSRMSQRSSESRTRRSRISWIAIGCVGRRLPTNWVR